METKTAVAALLRSKAAEVGFPEFFRGDLDHDCHTLEEMEKAGEPLRFGWVLRQAGTHLVWPGPEAGKVLRHILAIQRQKGGPEADPHVYFFFDGERLIAVSPEDLEERLIRG
ncbi:MAG: hypothetical protein QW260_06195 [Thermoproteota archaeon]